MGWTQFLGWCATPSAIPAVVGLLLSVIAEYVPPFGYLNSKQKRLVVMALSFAVPLGAVCLGILTANWGTGWESTWWPALVAGFEAYMASQVAHLRKLPGQ